MSIYIVLRCIFYDYLFTEISGSLVIYSGDVYKIMLGGVWKFIYLFGSRGTKKR
jgi:hypothetical protein